ncbi:MAG: hypothetical protein H6R26_268, partial [Proteobacteria bacterium]|nr:hypothetical protein [Pseudomonadota bacterium]
KEIRRVVFIAVVPLLLHGCSFSESSKSSSDSASSISESASSPSRWISDSSKTERERYEQDVRDYTAEYVKSSRGDLETFRVRVAKLAEKHGIVDWAADKTTYLAIGQGLRKAGLKGPQYEAFKASLGNSSPTRMESIEEGYR